MKIRTVEEIEKSVMKAANEKLHAINKLHMERTEHYLAIACNITG